MRTPQREIASSFFTPHRKKISVVTDCFCSQGRFVISSLTLTLAYSETIAQVAFAGCRSHINPTVS
jgi:hypothetical protein